MAEVRGVDLRQRLDRATAEELYDAFLEYGVLVLPGQALTIDQHLDFARLFGDLWELPVWNDLSRIKNRAIDDVSNLDLNGDLAGADSEKVFFLSGNKRWHSDLSNNSVAAKASLLHALEIALDGGETEFADPRAGYEALSGELKDRLEGLIGQFSFAYSTAKTNLDAEKLRELVPPSQHPIVRVHPETGRKNLFIGANLERVLGLSDGESAALIEELATFTAQERFVYRHRWAVHDLIVWDNRCTLHRAADYDVDRYRRVMHRATVRDEGPNVVDGKIVVPEIRRRGPRLANVDGAQETTVAGASV